MTRAASGRADFLELGSWNAMCAMCGRKRKSSQMQRNWKNQYVCYPEHWEPRHAQDFVKSILEAPCPPWSQPMPEPIFGPIVSPNSTSSIPSLIIPGQSIPSRRS